MPDDVTFSGNHFINLHLSIFKGVDSAKDLSDDNLKANGLFPGAGQTNFVSNGSNNSNSANGGSVNSQDSLWNVKSNNGVQIPADVMQQQQQQYR